MNMDFWDADGLGAITLPMLLVAGDQDNISGYEQGVRAIYEQAGSRERYMLIFKNGGHTVGAPIPLPVEFLDRGPVEGASHYQDPVWDSVRSNNILQHFATAFLDVHLKGDESKRAYLDLAEDGLATGEAQWKGFPEETAVGLKIYRSI